MIKHIIVGITLFILLTKANIFETDGLGDSLTGITDEPVSLFAEVADEPVNLYTELLDDPFSLSTEGPIAGVQVDCHANGDIDNLFLSGDVARVRLRREACSDPLPLPPYTDIYDSNGILNQLSPATVPKIPGQKEENILNLERQWALPGFTTTTDGQEEEDLCPKELVGDSQKPVCSSGSFGRDDQRLPGEDWYTLYNVRHFSPNSPCERPEKFWCCFSVVFAHHPLDPPESPDVLTGFICISPKMRAFDRAYPTTDPWVQDPSLDEGKPLYEPPK